METVLITGASGLIGSHLSQKLTKSEFRVEILSRFPEKKSKYTSYYWDYKKNEFDLNALANANYVIHLAGANIGQKRWTKQRKQEIIDSRVKSTQFLLQKIKESAHKPKAFIAASAIGYYGAITSDKIFEENDPPASDFLGTTCKLWEDAVKLAEDQGIRTVIIRTGIVLSQNGGALAKMAVPVKLFIGSSIGSGKQYMPWIHIDDLCELYSFAITNSSMIGQYNAVNPEHQTNKTFTKLLAKVLHRPFWYISVPSFFIKTIFGEMAGMLLNGSRISSEKLINSGFKFKYTNLRGALIDCFNKR